MNLNFKSEPYKEKSFVEKVSFFVSTAKDAVRTTTIDTSIEFLNTYKENLNKLNELSKEADELKKTSW
jgi:methyltransferase-like protein